MNSILDTLTQKAVTWLRSTGGALHVTDGVVGFLKTRYMSVVLVHPGADVAGANTNASTFTEAEDARKIFATITSTGTASTKDDYCTLVLDAPNGIFEKVFLDAANAGDLVDERFITIRIPYGIRTELPISETAIRRVGAKPTVVGLLTLEAY